MANLRYRLWGLSGSRKTCTALTGRGKQAVIDRDNQMFMYWRNPRFAEIFSPFATMLEDFSEPGPDGKPLSAGSPAVWLAMDPSRTTRDRVKEFCHKAGLGPGDQLVDDPFSALWEMSLDASDVKFGQKGMKVDFYGLKQPTTRLMNYYKTAPFDVCFTAHQKAEWDKNTNAPSDRVTPTGESQRTPRDIMFEFRLELVGDRCKMYVTKEKGMLFKVGESFDNPVLRDIFAARGLYDFVDGLHEEAPVDMDEQHAEALLAPVDAAVQDFIDRMREAHAAGKLKEFRADAANKRLVGSMKPAEQEAVIAAVKELGK